jgi:cytochrome c peroxidase
MKTISLIAAGLLATSAAVGQEQPQWQALPTVAPAPADNPTTPAKVELGKMLFFDPRFSSTGTVSCSSCHNVMEGGGDQRPTSIGVHGQKGGRNAPTVWNAALLSVQFWDGRAATLEEQAKGPPVNPIEMGMENLRAVIDRIQHIQGYKPYFEKAFGAGDVVTMDNAARAIAAYERTLLTPNSPYDRYVKGDKSALSEQQVRGMKTFVAVGCMTCHKGPLFAGPALPTGTGNFVRFPSFPQNPYVVLYDLMKDTGRFAVTHNPADVSVWRVPMLRNLSYTAPYMHNGSVNTLPDAVRVMTAGQIGHNLADNEVDDIVAFLLSLNGEFPPQTMPQLPPTPADLLAP